MPFTFGDSRADPMKPDAPVTAISINSPENILSTHLVYSIEQDGPPHNEGGVLRVIYFILR